MAEEKLKFLVAGMVTSIEFQRCRFYTERLYKSRPNKFEKPDIRSFLNVSWSEYLTKIRRKIGGSVWSLKKHCAVFLNGNYIGDDDDLFKYVLDHGRIRIGVDFHNLGVGQLKEILARDISNGQKFVYFAVAIDGINIGSMLFGLYEELVPQTTNLFLRRCRSKRNGWINRKIHRIVKGCWLQGGGFDLKHKRLPCENYIIPHNRRGVLSMCNNGKHANNSVQYIISLNPTPWMDYKYVAFGQLIQGEEILRKIEAVKTRYESPVQEITVILSGEYNVDLKTDPKDIEVVSRYFKDLDTEYGLPKDVISPFDNDSDLHINRYQKGDYCLESDLKNNIGLVELPSFLIQRFMEYTGATALTDDEEEAQEVIDEKLIPITMDLKYQASLKLAKSQHIDEEEINEKEVIQKVVEFDKISLADTNAVHFTSSEKIHKEEAETLFV